MCSHCEVGLCGQLCFENFHIRKGFQLVPAARRQVVPIPDSPQRRLPSTQDEPVPGPSGTRRSEALSESTSDDDSLSSPESNTHKLVRKPPTSKKKHQQKNFRQL